MSDYARAKQLEDAWEKYAPEVRKYLIRAAVIGGIAPPVAYGAHRLYDLMSTK